MGPARAMRGGLDWPRGAVSILFASLARRPAAAFGSGGGTVPVTVTGGRPGLGFGPRARDQRERLAGYRDVFAEAQELRATP
jgi:hypothetical protein